MLQSFTPQRHSGTVDSWPVFPGPGPILADGRHSHACCGERDARVRLPACISPPLTRAETAQERRISFP